MREGENRQRAEEENDGAASRLRGLPGSQEVQRDQNQQPAEHPHTDGDRFHVHPHLRAIHGLVSSVAEPPRSRWAIFCRAAFAAVLTLSARSRASSWASASSASGTGSFVPISSSSAITASRASTRAVPS